MPKIKNEDWLNKHLKILVEFAEPIKDNGITTEYYDYTALKLIAIRYYASIFARIVDYQKQKGWYDGAVYVDLFAGTGLVKLKGSKYDDFIPGSPLCAASNSNSFDYIVCVESMKERCDVLEERLGRILPKGKFDVIHGDSNKKIDEVIALIKKRFNKPILLTFADPEGLEIKFFTLKALSDAFLHCDFVINVNAQGVKRVSGKYGKGITNVKDSLENYLNADANTILQELAEGKTPEKQYEKLVKEVLGKSMGSIIKINDEGEKVAYYLLGYTRETQGGSEYSKAFSDLARRMNWADKHDVRKEIEKIHKRQTELGGFFKT